MVVQYYAEKKKILIVVPNLGLGGQERVAVDTARLLSKTYDVKIVCFTLSEHTYETDAEVIDLDVPASNSLLMRIFHVVQRVLKMRKLKEEWKPDFTYSVGNTANLVNVLSGGRDSKIVSLHSWGAVKDISFIDKIVYRRSDEIVCCSKTLAQMLREKIPSVKHKAIGIPNPLNINQIIQMGKEDVDDYEFTGRTIVCHARLHEVKNFPRMIKAVSLLHAEYKDVRLLIIGDGPMYNMLKQFVKTCGCEDYVTLLGQRKNPFAYIAKSDVFCLSSFLEGFSCSLVEAMCFLPAVSVDCPTGPGEILTGEVRMGDEVRAPQIVAYGVLAPRAEYTDMDSTINTDDISLAESIKMLLDDKRLYNELKEKARNRVEDFSENIYEKQLLKLLR